jgi:hypothetical protein
MTTENTESTEARIELLSVGLTLTTDNTEPKQSGSFSVLSVPSVPSVVL